MGISDLLPWSVLGAGAGGNLGLSGLAATEFSFQAILLAPSYYLNSRVCLGAFGNMVSM